MGQQEPPAAEPQPQSSAGPQASQRRSPFIQRPAEAAGATQQTQQVAPVAQKATPATSRQQQFHSQRWQGTAQSRPPLQQGAVHQSTENAQVKIAPERQNRISELEEQLRSLRERRSQLLTQLH